MMVVSTFTVAGAGLVFGCCVGIGIAIGLEAVMRIAGDGRTVILTWAKTKHGNVNGEEAQK